MILDALQQLADELFAHAGKRVELAGLCRRFQGAHIRDLQGGPDQGDDFGAHAWEAKELEHGGAILLEELIA